MKIIADTEKQVWGRIQHVVRTRGLNRSRIYQLVADGSITAVKDGRALMIELASVDNYLASLPKATIRLPKTLARQAAVTNATPSN